MYSSVLHGHATGLKSISYKHAKLIKDYPDSDFY